MSLAEGVAIGCYKSTCATSPPPIHPAIDAPLATCCPKFRAPILDIVHAWVGRSWVLGSCSTFLWQRRLFLSDDPSSPLSNSITSDMHVETLVRQRRQWIVTTHTTRTVNSLISRQWALEETIYSMTVTFYHKSLETRRKMPSVIVSKSIHGWLLLTMVCDLHDYGTCRPNSRRGLSPSCGICHCTDGIRFLSLSTILDDLQSRLQDISNWSYRAGLHRRILTM